MWLSYDYEEFIRELENLDVEADSTIYIRRQRRSDSSYVPIVEYSFEKQDGFEKSTIGDVLEEMHELSDGLGTYIEE